MLPVLHIDEEALRPRIERAKLRGRRSFSLQDHRRRRQDEDDDDDDDTKEDDASVVSRLVRSRSSAHAEVSSRLGMRRERCASCGEPVFLAEKLVVARSSYHRSCFRCARCRHQLTPGNYYETEDGQYCCEACPIDEPGHRALDLDLDLDLDLQLDRQQQQQIPQLTSQREPPDQQQQQQQQAMLSSEAALLEAPLSDEEKSKQLEQQLPRSAAPEDRPEDNNNDDDEDQLDHMLKLINDRIDQLTTTGPQPENENEEVEVEEEEAEPPPPPSPAATTSARRSRVHSAPEVVQPRPSSSDDPTKKQRDDERPGCQLRRSSSLGLVSEHTKEQQQRQPTQPPRRRLSLGQQSPLDEPKAHPVAAEPEPEPEPEPQGQQPKQEDDGDYPDDLNPFASEDEEEEVQKAHNPTNPFGSDDDDDDEELPPKPMARTKSKRRVLAAPQINLNPFWSDDEGPDEAEEAELRDKSPPVPRPRTLRHSHADGTATLQPRSNLAISSIHSSNTSIASSCSTLTPGGTYRKKKPAPPPPLPTSTPPRSLDSSSPKLTPRTRKSKPAPPPPPPPPSSALTSPQLERYSTSALPPPPPPPAQEEDAEVRLRGDDEQSHWQQSGDKLSKDEANRNTRSLSCTESSLLYPGQLDKSLEGKWKRKKGPAPPRPMPLRRKIKVMSMKDVKLELDQIEMQQQGLERQGVRLEQIIRDKCETGTAAASEETSLGLDVEELVLELFALVNEKNELFRRQAELMLLRRQQRLEEEHADIEYQVRCLITQPEATKTDFDKQREETLIQRLVEIVEKRNEIVECLEMDRRREIEEDRSIHREMDLYAARNKAENVNLTDESRRSTLLFKKGKAKEKVKEKKSKKSSKKDADKDVDETEAKLKRHTLRKWF